MKGSHESTCFPKVKICQIRWDGHRIHGFAWWMRERELHKQTWKMKPKSILESMTTPCKNHARTRDAKTYTKHWKCSPKGNRKQLKINSKQMSETMMIYGRFFIDDPCFYGSHLGSFRVPPRRSGRHPAPCQRTYVPLPPAVDLFILW